MSDTPLLIDGLSLTIRDVVEVARQRRRVAVAPEACPRIARCRVMIEVLLAAGEKVYGLTTGFGKLRDVAIEPADTERLQENLLMSHAAGVGAPFAEDVVRAAMLLRANTLCRGHSGARLEVVEALVALLNDDVYPHVPSQGSVGCSGDLAPLSHLGLVVIGHPAGRVFARGRATDAAALVREPRAEDFVGPEHPDFPRFATFRPVRLQAKEGLALNNGTQFMAALGCLAVHDADLLVHYAEMAGAMSLEANRGVLTAYDDRIHAVRDLPGQQACARRVRTYCDGSQILGLYLNSAHLFRARVLTHEALEHLQRGLDELERGGREAPWPALQLRKGLQALAADIERLVPVRKSGEVDAQVIDALLAMSPRAQIRWLEHHVAETRREASTLLQAVSVPTFPRTEATGKLQTAMVGVVHELQQSVPAAPFVQDDYSFRCFPQVAACAVRALSHVAEILAVEINSATDNPLLFPPEPPDDVTDYRAWLAERPDECARNVLGGGNFHGQPIATAMDYLAIAVAELGSIAERRVAHLIDDHASRGLPGFLIEATGLNSGLMIPQYTAAALVSENKILCHPASVDSIPTCANTEDHVSMGTIAARKAAQVLANVKKVVAIELMTAQQGLKFRMPLQPGERLRRVVECMRAAGISPIDHDTVMAPRMERVERLMDEPALLALLLD